MESNSRQIFIDLFTQAHQKCFGAILTEPLTETASRHFSNVLLDTTGLVVGAKSIKNFSIDILSNGGANENPSAATLDTFARYVLGAPYTDELTRKEKENHFPYWFRYKSEHAKTQKRIYLPKKGLVTGVIIVIAFCILFFFYPERNKSITDTFQSLQEDSLAGKGWMVLSKSEPWWSRRSEQAGALTLYTLRGDNWPDSSNNPVIRNLLLQKIPEKCFSAEVRLDRFFPKQNWQQAGIILLEDTILSSKGIRLSISYNDFFGGYDRPAEILLQGITTAGGKDKPEEIIHQMLYSFVPGQEKLVYNNMHKAGLKIEKQGNIFRFLYSTSPVENFAYKEALKTELAIHPKYIGIFAIQGFTKDTGQVAARVTYFNMEGNKCK